MPFRSTSPAIFVQFAKDQDIRIRVTEEQKQTLIDAAARAGLGVRSWLLMLGLREAGADR